MDAKDIIPGKVPTLWVTDAPQQAVLSHGLAHFALSASFARLGLNGRVPAGRIIQFMQHDPIDRLIHSVSPRVWLLILLVSLLLAGGSSWILLSHRGESPKDSFYSVYDTVVRFKNDTIRLTFRTDKNQASVFVAPIGILNQKADFKWVERYHDFKPRSEDRVEEPKAPIRLLDSEWRPIFSDDYRRKEF